MARLQAERTTVANLQQQLDQMKDSDQLVAQAAAGSQQQVGSDAQVHCMSTQQRAVLAQSPAPADQGRLAALLALQRGLCSHRGGAWPHSMAAAMMQP